MQMRLSKEDVLFKYLAVAPLLLLLVAFAAYPIMSLLNMSFSNVTIVQGRQTTTWAGFDNYLRTLDDPIFITAFLHTLVYVIISVVLEGALGLMFALLITSVKRGSIVFRTILLLPFLIPPVVNGTMWKLILNAQFGLLNLINQTFGLPIQSLLSEESTALAGIIMVTVWQWIGYNTLILYAGLQTLPKSVIEAAKIDGASSARILFNITIPLIKPVLFVAVTFRMIHAFKGFDLIYVLTGGGPGYATEIINTYIQKVFMQQRRMGYGSAISLITIILVLILFFTFNRFMERRNEK
ncbi:MAG: sugar ABC transporter permease [Sphaerochaetaceae bacterium]|jgi:multiple sugar transport system permease protein|nr:sugar ABC transporter permease [Sphaerochaetaceae bacterium]MDD4763495.1 sugar ABC transporter permease [Sphaerochaetaceae bacterium]